MEPLGEIRFLMSKPWFIQDTASGKTRRGLSMDYAKKIKPSFAIGSMSISHNDRVEWSTSDAWSIPS